MEFFTCVKWSGWGPAFFLCSLAAAGLVVGALITSALWRPASLFARLPKSQVAWIGVLALASSIGLLLTFVPPIFGYNRCP